MSKNQANLPILQELQLCRLLEIKNPIRDNSAENGFREEDRIYGSALKEMFDGLPGPLTDERLNHIICRWKGLRVLATLYFDSIIHDNFEDIAIASANGNEPSNAEPLKAAAERIAVIATNPPPVPSQDSSMTEKYERFYMALNTYWYALEFFWLLQRSHTNTWVELWDMVDKVADRWYGGTNQTVLEVEMLEVHGFLYYFLSRIVFRDLGGTKEWIGDNSLGDFFDGAPFDEELWTFFVHNCRHVLKPAEVLELVLATCLTHTNLWPPSREKYLRDRGAFDFIEAFCSYNPDHFSVDW